MMVTFISQCEKNALKKTRRVLDSFANRIGDNTWQTIITQEGLKAVKKLLRKTASKSTAVSCHWIRSRSRSEFLWVVGNRDRFSDEGIVPVNRTQKTILDNYKESDWKYLPLIKALVALSALLHDWGKSSRLFQEKLKNATKKGDPIRHEWISCMLLNAFIAQNENSEEQWLKSLALGEIDEKSLKVSVRGVDKQVLRNLPNSAKLVMWLILSHHRLPLDTQEGLEESHTLDDALKYITKAWGYENIYDEEDNRRLEHCFEFPHGLLSDSKVWLKEVKKWSNRMLGTLNLLEESLKDSSYRLVLHHARLTLMLGDHHYSSQDADSRWRDATGLFANTDRKTKAMNQKLDEHLCGVMKSALHTSHLLPAFENRDDELPVVKDNRALKKPSPKAFTWQDKAVKKIEPMMDSSSKQGFFAVNMASTGCGKTFANAKVMRAVSHDKKSLRYILALGLRTLTLQTGYEYREKMELEEDDLALLIGSKAVKELHDRRLTQEQGEKPEDYGSESLEKLLDEEVVFDSSIPEEGLSTELKGQKQRALLYAPVLVCTIDHIMGAVDTKRGGKFILPSLRLMGSDLVIDEIDDFTGSDLIAIGRLVHLAGMLGRKVMISSATIPPDLAEGYFNAYQKGWELFCKTREAKSEIVCAWIDEFKTEVVSVRSQDTVEAYQEAHNAFIVKRVAKLAKEPIKRKVEVVTCQEHLGEGEKSYFSKIKEAIVQKHHQHHTVDKTSNIKVSFGVVRMANIQPCINLAQYLMAEAYGDEVEVRVMAYHSNQVLLLRHEQERYLEKILKRKEVEGEEAQAFKDKTIRSHLDGCVVKNMIFIVVATPVEEVGRDHDFDWAVVEPSSYRSIIQLAGRVRRHRGGAVSEPNIALMQYNLKSFKANDDSVRSFEKPGYEVCQECTLKTHNISELVDVKQIGGSLNATPRIQKPKKLKPQASLSDLEHAMTHDDLTDYEYVDADTFQGYLEGSYFLTAYPQLYHPFRKSDPSINTFLTYSERKDRYIFTEYDKFGKIIVDDVYGEPIDRGVGLNISYTDEVDERFLARAWLKRDYNTLVEEYAEKMGLSKQATSLKYGELSFNAYEMNQPKYEYDGQFGLVRV